MNEIKGCMNCGNISCGNNKKRRVDGCGRYISPEDKIKELEKEVIRLRNESLDIINKYTRFAETDRKTITKLQQACHKWFMRWREAKKDAMNLQKEIESLKYIKQKFHEGCMTLAHQVNIANGKLTKAKNALKKFVDFANGERTIPIKWIAETEQFLSEVEN